MPVGSAAAPAHQHVLTEAEPEAHEVLEDLRALRQRVHASEIARCTVRVRQRRNHRRVALERERQTENPLRHRREDPLVPPVFVDDGAVEIHRLLDHPRICRTDRNVAALRRDVVERTNWQREDRCLIISAAVAREIRGAESERIHSEARELRDAGHRRQRAALRIHEPRRHLTRCASAVARKPRVVVGGGGVGQGRPAAAVRRAPFVAKGPGSK